MNYPIGECIVFYKIRQVVWAYPPSINLPLLMKNCLNAYTHYPSTYSKHNGILEQWSVGFHPILKIDIQYDGFQIRAIKYGGNCLFFILIKKYNLFGIIMNFFAKKSLKFRGLKKLVIFLNNRVLKNLENEFNENWGSDLWVFFLQAVYTVKSRTLLKRVFKYKKNLAF